MDKYPFSSVHPGLDTKSYIASEAPKLEIPSDFYFIQHFYGAPGQTHYWNQFGLKAGVAVQVSEQVRPSSARTLSAAAHG